MTSAPANVLQTSFPMAPPGVPSPVGPQVSQPLFPVNTSTVNGAASSPFVASIAPGTIPASSPAAVGYGVNNQGTLILNPYSSMLCNVHYLHILWENMVELNMCIVEFVTKESKTDIDSYILKCLDFVILKEKN